MRRISKLFIAWEHRNNTSYNIKPVLEGSTFKSRWNNKYLKEISFVLMFLFLAYYILISTFSYKTTHFTMKFIKHLTDNDYKTLCTCIDITATTH